jgi:hypothetical protein
MAVEHIPYKGQTWTRVTTEPLRRFVMGVDLAQSVDFTAIAVVEHCRAPHDNFDVDFATNVLRQRADERFDLVYLERVKRGTPYPEIVQHVASLLARDPLRTNGCDLVIDATGVGRPVYELACRSEADRDHHHRRRRIQPRRRLVARQQVAIGGRCRCEAGDRRTSLRC